MMYISGKDALGLMYMHMVVFTLCLLSAIKHEHTIKCTMLCIYCDLIWSELDKFEVVQVTGTDNCIVSHLACPSSLFNYLLFLLNAKVDKVKKNEDHI